MLTPRIRVLIVILKYKSVRTANLLDDTVAARAMARTNCGNCGNCNSRRITNPRWHSSTATQTSLAYIPCIPFNIHVKLELISKI